MNVNANGKALLTDFDIVGDADPRTADVKVFSNIAPATDGLLHLGFSSANGGGAILSGIDLLPGEAARIRPILIVARDVPYYSNDSHWWSADVYFKADNYVPAISLPGTRTIPSCMKLNDGSLLVCAAVMPGKYTLTLHFIERGSRSLLPPMSLGRPDDSPSRVFSVFCNGKTILRDVNIFKEVGEDRPLIMQVNGLAPNAQGKVILEFAPTSHYATLAALELWPE